MATCVYDDGYVEECSVFDAYLYPLVDDLDRSGLAMAVKESTTIVPWAGAVHLLMLALIGGCVLLVDMRVMGFGLKSYTPAALERRVRPLLIGALIVMVISGSLLALGELMKLYYSVPYWNKMAALGAALLFTFAARPRIYDPERRLGHFRRLLTIIAILLWVYVFALLASTLAWWAMALLALALLVMALAGERQRPPGERVHAGTRLTGATSIALWLTVAVSGRWIAFY